MFRIQLYSLMYILYHMYGSGIRSCGCWSELLVDQLMQYGVSLMLIQ